jgi:cathepsin B
LHFFSIILVVNCWESRQYHRLEFPRSPILLSYSSLPSRLNSVYIAPSNSTFGAGNYSFFDEFPDCYFEPVSQGRCLSCWAIAVSAVISHRFCRALKRRIVLNFSDLLNCGSHLIGCASSGHEYLGWRHLEFVGLPELGCEMSNLSCDRSNCSVYFTEYRSGKTFIGEDEIRAEILRNGPVTALFEMTNSFFDYGSGVFADDSKEPGQLHTVEIVGWGVEDYVPYWLAQNSFGPEWGERGLFKILRGVNHRGIEQYATAGRPRLPR